MSNATELVRSLAVYGLCLPLAIFLGYLLANPLDFNSLVVTGLILFLLLVPLLLRWHHAWLIAAWNMSAVVFFMPGRPPVWTALAVLSLAIGILQYAINRNAKFLSVPAVTWPLLFLGLVVLITASLRGGIGLRVFGSSSYGGRNYFGIIAAIVGYFAITSRRIPPKRAVLYVTLFFLGSATMAIGDLPMVLPREFNFVYLIFPLLESGSDAIQATSVVGATSDFARRVTGLGFLSGGLFCAMMARYGLRGIFLELTKPWRALLLVIVIGIGMLGGFRSTVVIMLMIFAVLFYMERLHQTRMLLVLLVVMVLGGTLMVTFANRLPFMMQRSIAFLPVNIDPLARFSAASSSEWRLQMWRDLLPQIPQYLFLGKGYSFSAGELFMTEFRGAGTEGAVLAGDYHNGPLSVIIPFGIFGSLAFAWFLWAGCRVTYQNFLFGDPAFHRINTFLFVFFLVKIAFFLTVFGGLVVDLTMFVGLVGLSISLNGGVAKRAVAPQAEPQAAFTRFKLHPAARRPVGV